MATRTRWAQETLGRDEADTIRQAVAGAREQGQKSVDYVPGTDVVGGAGVVALRRKAHCRRCGEAMPKGADAIQFAYRWVPAFRYRITESFMHPERCR